MTPLPEAQHAWEATFRADELGRPVAPRFHRLLMLDVRGAPTRADAERLGTALRTLEQRFEQGAIARPTWLTDDPPAAHGIRVTQDPRTDGMLARGDLAAALVPAIEQPLTRGKSFALFNEPGEPPRDWARVFAGPAPDLEPVAA
jgi:hypothetical protein